MKDLPEGLRIGDEAGSGREARLAPCFASCHRAFETEDLGVVALQFDGDSAV